MRTDPARCFAWLLLLAALAGAAGPAAARERLWSPGRAQVRAAEHRPEPALFRRREARQPAEPAQRAQPEPQAQRPSSPFQPTSEPRPGLTTAPAAPEHPAIAPSEAARRAQQQYGGRVLSVFPSEGGYRVKLLKDGEVSVVNVPN